MNIVIVAAGLSSRLAPLTNCIPKFLVNIGKSTGYVAQVRYWLQYSDFTKPDDSLTVIVHSKYKSLVQAYHELYFPQVPLIIKTVDVANGSAHAILSTCEHLVGKSVFFQWCDVLPVELFIPSKSFSESNVVFLNYTYSNRYGVTTKDDELELELQEDGKGGVFGLYYICNFSTEVNFADGQDFVEVLTQFGELNEFEFTKIIDWGDKPKLEQARATSDSAREFNKVEVHNNLVLKSAANQQGEGLIAREINWYKALEELNSPVQVPKTWVSADNKSFIMSNVTGAPVYKLWPSLKPEGRALVLKRVFEQLKLLHGTQTKQVSTEQVIADIKVEAYDKLINRYREIKPVIDAFGPVTHVNGWRLDVDKTPEEAIRQVHAKLVKLYEGFTEYNVIHGDLQFSNSMLNPYTLEVTLIDPRGYFGNSTLFGLADYDLAKLYYSLSGYDLFNYSQDFHIKKLENGALEFDMPKPKLKGCALIMDNHFLPKHQLWLAVIWMGLGAYIKNDPVKALCAHYHGLAMADKILDECFDEYCP